MTKSVKTLIAIIGILSILSGLYLAFNGSELTEYFSGIFLGVVLLGSIFYHSKNENPHSGGQ